MKLPKLDTAKQEREQPVLSIHTGKLIEDRPFDPVPSVTEDSTDLLRMPDDRRNR